MVRTVKMTLVLLFGVLVAGVAQAAVPVPTPKPTHTSASAEAAIASLVSAPDSTVEAASAYAPSTAAVEPAPELSGKVALYVVGKLSENGEPIASGLTWRVYRDFPDENGELPIVHRASGGDLEMRLDPGRYIVHASYGRAAVSRHVSLASPVTSETMVLDAGGLMLQAVMDGETTDVRNPTFELYMLEGEGRTAIGTLEPGTVARLPAGAYHVVSRFGSVNAVRSADVEVVAGKLTQVALRHRAGNVRLKLVRAEGGEAIADTEWTVFTDNGEEIFTRVGAHANLTLAAGEYAVVAKHRDVEFSRSFVVQSGADKDVVVLARRL